MPAYNTRFDLGLEDIDLIESALQTFENVSGFSGPCELIVVAGQK